MKQPACNSMAEVAMILTKMGEAEGTMAALKEQLKTVPYRMGRELFSENDRLHAARCLYWYIQDIPTAGIAEGLLGMQPKGLKIQHFLDCIGANTLEVNWDLCNQPMRCRSRQEMRDILRDARREGAEYAEGYRLLCPACWRRVQYERTRP